MLSPEYVETLKRTHASQSWGASGHSHAPSVDQWRRSTLSKSVLDYGCGQGTLKPALLQRKSDLDVREYDPGIDGKDSPPEVADLVVALDVLEHIEPPFVDETLRHLRSLTKKAAFFVIALKPSKVTLSDGRNAHLSLLPPAEWHKRLFVAGFKITKSRMIRDALWVWAQ